VPPSLYFDRVQAEYPLSSVIRPRARAILAPSRAAAGYYTGSAV